MSNNFASKIRGPMSKSDQIQHSSMEHQQNSTNMDLEQGAKRSHAHVFNAEQITCSANTTTPLIVVNEGHQNGVPLFFAKMKTFWVSCVISCVNQCGVLS